MTLAVIMRRFGCAVAMALALCPAQPVFADGELEKIEIITADGPHAFSIELMSTDAEHKRGLMFRRFLPADRGMLFDFHDAAPVMMWMKIAKRMGLYRDVARLIGATVWEKREVFMQDLSQLTIR